MPPRPLPERFWPLAWPVAALLSCLLLWWHGTHRADLLMADADQSARREVRAHAEAFEQYLTRTLSQMDQLTMQLKHSWEQSGGKLEMGQLYRDGMFTDAAFLEVSVFDAGGRLLSTGGRQRATAGLPAAFAYHAANNSTVMRIGVPPADNGARQRAVQFSRRLDHGEDGFAGVLSVLVDANYLTAFYNGRILGGAGMVAITGESGLRLERHGEQVSLAPGISLFSMAPELGLSGGTALLLGTSFHDGAPRLMSWHHSSAYPVIALAAISADDALARAEAEAALVHRTTLLYCVLACVLGLFGWWQTARLLRTRRHDAEARQAYRAATEQANDGFYLAAARRNRRDQVVDFEIIDCNERGAYFYGLTRQQLIGRRISALDSAVVGEDLLPVYQGAMQSGFHEDEREMGEGPQLNIRWGRRRIVRVGDSLAITLQDISAHKRHENDLARLANEDALTQLANRHWLQHQLPRLLADAGQHSQQLAVLFIDLDDFKQVNDTLGPASGDRLLQAAARRLQALLGNAGWLARVGGDEFVVLLSPLHSESQAAELAAGIVAAFATPFALAADSVNVGASVGISLFPRDGHDYDTLIRHADIAMHAGKSERKGQYRFFDPSLYVTLTARAQLRHGLQHAIDARELQLHYQARVDVDSGALASMEALLRWRHPELGLVPPAKFIPLAEASGLIVRIGEQVIEQACAQLAAWRAQGLPLVPVSINVSPRQFSYGSVHGQLAAQLARFDLPPQLLEVEITESAMADLPEIQNELAAIRELGVRVYVDDFGTGYSSLAQLQKLKLDGLKVDQAFTAELDRSSEGRVFFEAIVSMARALGMVVVAEGVETAEQLALLRQLGCNEAQGYLVGRPVPPGEMALRLAETRQHEIA